jgi:hypothetical protein
MKLQQHLLSCDRRPINGFTTLELVVSSFLSLLILGLALGSVLVSRDSLGRDTVRTRLVQNLRGSLDIAGSDIRVAGENLNSSFPAVNLINGVNAPDSLIVRRNLIGQVFPLCVAIPVGSTSSSISVADGSNNPGCSRAAQTYSYTQWKTFRLTNGGSTDAFIYNSATKSGEFFKYISEVDSGTQYSLIKGGSAPWQAAYPVASTSIYLLEEWQYKVQNQRLLVIQNRDQTNPLTVSFGITDFQISLTLADGSTRSAFSDTDNWTLINAVSLSLSGQDSFRKKVIQRTLTAAYFPRNVLSN